MSATPPRGRTRLVAGVAVLALLVVACDSTTRVGGLESFTIDDLDDRDGTSFAATELGDLPDDGTVGEPDGPEPDDPLDDSEPVGGDQDQTAPSQTSGEAAPSTTGSPPPTQQGSGTGTSSAPASPSSEERPRPRTGRGVTESEIRIGFQVSDDLDTGFAAVGADGDAADERRIISALLEHVNANGGIDGRTVVPIFHGTSALSGTWASQAQAACATFTEDNEVFAVVSSTVGGSDAMLACTASKGTPLIEQNLWLFDQQYYERFAGWLYQPGKLRADRWARAYVDGLARAGFFDGGKLGIARFDAPVFGRIADGVVKPELQRHGVRVEAEAILSTPQSVGDFGRMSSEINNAQLRFRQAGVDRVIFIENAGILPFFWMPSAESQGYRPRYGLASNSIPATIARQADPRQLRGAMGVGWTPPNDVDTAEDYPANPASDECLRILREQGIPPHWAGFYTHSACEAIFFLRAVVPRVPEFSPGGFQAGVESLGTSYRGPFAIGTRLGQGRHDGGSRAQLFTYQERCECFRYQGSSWQVP